MINILGFTEGRVIAAKATGKLTDTDYYKLLPLFINRLRQYPTIRLYFEVDDLEESDLKEFLDDVELYIRRHSNTFDKVAILGKNKDELWMRYLNRFFLSAEVKIFETIKRDEAIEWIKT